MVTAVYTKRPRPFHRVWQLILVGLNFVFKPLVIIPVAAFVAGFCICLILTGKWADADREYTNTLEESIKILQKELDHAHSTLHNTVPVDVRDSAAGAGLGHPPPP